MKHLPVIARYLLGALFLVFGLNFWLKFIPIPAPAEGSPAAAFMGALYASGFLTVVKLLEVVGAVLLLAGRYVNLALAWLGPIVVVIGLYHFFIVKGGYGMAVVLGALALTALAGRREFVSTLFNAK
jgi:uncharacterized membrane protein YphA (DoxX/SURF4 family)